jgi:Ni/Co efflux regulator RcnB
MMATLLIVSIVLSFVAVAILPIQQAGAKQCNSDNKNNNNDKDDTHSASCIHDQQNSDNHHNDSSTTSNDKTPFRLPFP